MNETGLIIAEVAFLALLYGFVWTVVRSAGRQLRSAPPPAAAAPAPAPAPAPAVVAPMAPAAPAASVAPAATVPAAPIPADISEDPTQGDWNEDPNRIELHDNLDPRLIVESSDALEVGRVIHLEGGMTIGRSEAAGVSLAGDQFASHMHARVMRRGAYHFVEDLGSTNGTFLNDRRVEGDAQLKVRDELRIGQTILRYEE
ncbi:MAG: FHA domain-containing protein [Thermoleophilia bacterium]